MDGWRILGTAYSFRMSSDKANTMNLYPFVNVDYLSMDMSSYKEHGAESLIRQLLATILIT